MTGSVIVDSNLLALLIVGGTSPAYVGIHKTTKDHFGDDDFELLTLLLKDYSEIVLVPHIVAETSNLVRQIGEPRRSQIQRVFSRFCAETYEMLIPSVAGFERSESVALGVTDAVLLHLCSIPLGDRPPTLLTIDGPLTDRAGALGYDVINFRRAFQS